MDDKAKEVFLSLKEKSDALKTSFEDVVTSVEKELEIPRRIAENLVTTELVNSYKKKLILYDLFSEKTLKECDIKF